MEAGGKILITSANGATAGLLIPRLRERGYATVGLIRAPAEVGTDETITDWMQTGATGDAMRAEEALAEAEIVIHLSGDANAKNKAAYIEANYATTKRVADHVRNGRCRRIIYLSYANAGIEQQNYYLHYKGAAEQLLLDTGKEVVIFRCPAIIDAPGQPSRMDELFISKNGKAVPVIGDGRQKMRPIYRGTVVDMLLAALEKGRPGRYELSGPEEMTVNDFIHWANRDPAVKMRHIPGWVCMLMSRFIPALSPTFVDLMLHHTNSIYAPATFAEFGVTPVPVSRLFSR